jgi:hypothetical protein
MEAPLELRLSLDPYEEWKRMLRFANLTEKDRAANWVDPAQN